MILMSRIVRFLQNMDMYIYIPIITVRISSSLTSMSGRGGNDQFSEKVSKTRGDVLPFGGVKPQEVLDETSG